MSEKLNDTLVYAARVKDKQVLKKSSSGGMLTPLSDFVLSRGGAVVCAIYNYTTHQVEYQLCEDKESYEKARGSKYIQSIPGDIFIKSMNWLNSHLDKKLLFIGMGCQAAGFRHFMQAKGMDSRIFVVDIICMGSPSPLIWKDAIQWLEEKEEGKVSFVTFKDKRKGWNQPTAFAYINGRECPIDQYVEIFYNEYASRPSCYKCPYTAIERETDMTIGDYWGIEGKLPEFYSSSGNSIVLIHTRSGQELFEIIKSTLDYKKSNLLGWLQPRLYEPSKCPDKREQFWKDYFRYPFKRIASKYGTVSWQVRCRVCWQRLKQRIKTGIKKHILHRS